MTVSLKRPYFPSILNQMLMCKLFPHQTWVLFYTNLPRACFSSMVNITIIMKPKHLLMTSYCRLAGVTVFNQSWNKTTKHSSGPLCAPALFLGNVKHQRTMFWRFCTKNKWYDKTLYGVDHNPKKEDQKKYDICLCRRKYCFRFWRASSRRRSVCRLV